VRVRGDEVTCEVMKRIITAIIAMAMLTLTVTGCVKTENIAKATEQPTEAVETEKATEAPKATAKATQKPKVTAAPKQTEEPAPSEKPTEAAKETAKATKAPKATEKAKKTSAPKETGHVHNWIPIKESQRVCVSEAYDEPIYEEIGYWHCSCGHDDYTSADNDAHMEAHALAGEGASWSIMHKTIQTGTKHHDAVYENREVTVGYRCECGATK